MKDEVVRGATSQIFEVFVQNAGATNGAGLTGLVFNSASLTAYYKYDNGSAAAAITLANVTTIGTWANNGFREVDATNMPGIYEFNPPNAAFSNTTANRVTFMMKGATNMAPVVFEVALKAVNTQDSVRAGMTALPNAAAEASGGLYTRGSGAGQITQDANGRIDANVKTWISGTIPAVNVTGVPLVDAKYLLGTIFSTPATAGILDANVKNVNNAAAATPGASGGMLISGSNSGTTTLGALTITGATTHTGNVVLSDGLTISAPSTGNRAGLDITGNGTGAAVKLAAGSTGKGIAITTTAGDGLSILPAGGSAIVATGQGTSKHGIIATGGTAGTSDGIVGAAGSGGVDIRGNITGNLTGTVATLTTYTGNTPQTGDSYAVVNSGTFGNSALKTLIDTLDDYVDTEVAAIKAKTDNLPSSPAAVGSAMTLTSGERTSIADATLTRSVGTESYAADGAVPTVSEMFFMIWSALHEFSISSTTLTTKKLDGSTTAMTWTLNDATNPTSRTRAT